MAYQPKKLLEHIVLLMLAGACATSLLLAAVFLYLNPQIPATSTYSKFRFETPLRVFSLDGGLIAEYGNRRLIPIDIEDVPSLYLAGLLGTEDKRFHDHFGIDLISLANDTVGLFTSDIRTGASTITMQLAKIVSLSPEQTFIRKFKEMLLALKIEHELSKQEILELYVNIVPFGKRSYGVQAAAHTYYGKPVSELNLPQLAMLAGIPKKPESGNPINGPEWALDRRNLVLRRMLDQGVIDGDEYRWAVAEPITAGVHQPDIDLAAPYPGEEVRRQLIARMGTDIYSGYEVVSTIDIRLQDAAQRAMHEGLLEYDMRHGYRGAEGFVATRDDATREERHAAYMEHLETRSQVSGLEPAVVTSVREQSLMALRQGGETVELTWDGIAWARRFITADVREAAPTGAADVARVGDVIRIALVDDLWRLRQIPQVRGALVAMDPQTGAIRALVGGFNFYRHQFNHAMQANRQPGSGFKPVLYSAALEHGITPASIFLDAPLVFRDVELETDYRPRNDTGSFRGPMRLREAFYRSVNLVSIRVLLEIGPNAVLDHAGKFGFETGGFPRNSQLAIGGGTITVTPLMMARIYAAFANRGFLVDPHLVTRVRQLDGTVVFEPEIPRVCNPCGEATPDESAMRQASTTPRTLGARRIIDERNAFVMHSMLGDVIRRGTGFRARDLGRTDLAGKTGTTNDATDTWFNGYHPSLVTTVWVGSSDMSSLGAGEYGSTTPLAIWMRFMGEALADVPTVEFPAPDGLVSIKIDPKTGEAASPTTPNAIFEFFLEEKAPRSQYAQDQSGPDEEAPKPEDIF